VTSLLDIAFPYRAKRTFGAASFALLVLVIIGEIEALVLVALGIIAHRLDLFFDLQSAILPAAAIVAFATGAVFWWRARDWSRRRMEMLDEWAAAGSAYGEQLARRRQG
jgi:hypothetical protein